MIGVVSAIASWMLARISRSRCQFDVHCGTPAGDTSELDEIEGKAHEGDRAAVFQIGLGSALSRTTPIGWVKAAWLISSVWFPPRRRRGGVGFHDRLGERAVGHQRISQAWPASDRRP